MTALLQKIIESKQALRRELAACSIAERLRIVESMRERLVISRLRRTDGSSEKRPAPHA